MPLYCQSEIKGAYLYVEDTNYCKIFIEIFML